MWILFEYICVSGVPMVNVTQRVDWTRVAAYELYDLTGDTGSDFDFEGTLQPTSPNTTLLFVLLQRNV